MTEIVELTRLCIAIHREVWQYDNQPKARIREFCRKFLGEEHTDKIAKAVVKEVIAHNKFLDQQTDLKFLEGEGWND